MALNQLDYPMRYVRCVPVQNWRTVGDEAVALTERWLPGKTSPRAVEVERRYELLKTVPPLLTATATRCPGYVQP